MTTKTAFKSQSKTRRSPAARQSGRSNGSVKSNLSPVTTTGSPGSFYASGPLFGLGGPAQAKLTIGQVNDPYEREADSVAEAVTGEQPAAAISRLPAGGLSRIPQRQSANEEKPIQELALQRQSSDEDEAVQRNGSHPSAVSPATMATLRNPGGGQPIPSGVRRQIEPHVGANLSGVRVHTGPNAQQAATHLRARAFTHRNHIFLNRTESPADTRLMAHESTHVVQQGAAAIQRQPLPGLVPQIQRLFDFSLDDIPGIDAADIARRVPGYTLFTVIIGYNPLTNSGVDRNAINLLQGLMELVPFGADIFDALQERGILQAAFEWVRNELDRLDLSLDRIERTLDAAWEEISLTSGIDYNLGVLQRHFGALYNDVVSFAASLVNQIIQMIKDVAIGVAEELLAENQAWALIKKVLHYDPLRGEEVSATTVEILEDFLRLIGKEQELEQMRQRGTLQETADWLDTQIATFLGLLAELSGLFSAAWEAIQPANLPSLMTNLQDLASRAFGFLQRVWDFATTVAAKVLELIKKALLGWLSSFVHEVPGFHLITVMLGKNPFTDEPVPRTPENIIRGFITLLPGGNAKYQQLQETGVIPAAAARIQGAMDALGINWEFVVGLFRGIWDSLSIDDLIDPIGSFQRIRDQFGEPISRLFAFIRVVVEEILKLVLQLMNFPTDLITSIISNAMQAFTDIKNDPVGFFLNMLSAVKLGFSNFFDHILEHLIGGLTDWLFRGLRDAGIEPPTDLSLESILDFVLQVLGISMDRIWEKLAERIGQENVDRIRRAIDRLVGIWNFVRDVQERGVVAIWEYIESQISGLWDMVLEKAQEWVMERIINRAIQWLLSLLDPTGIMPVINSFIAFFRAVQSAIEYLRDILAIINDYVSTIASIARGAIEPGAQKMEQGLANTVPIAIGFLANQFGLGRIGDKIQEIVAGIRGVIDRALDWLLDRAVSAGQALLRSLGMGGAEEGGEEAATPENIAWWEDEEPVTDSVGASHTLLFRGSGTSATLVMHSEEQVVSDWLVEQRESAPDAVRPLFEEALRAYNSFVQAKDALEARRAIFETLSAEDQAAQRPEIETIYQMYRSTLRTLGRSFNVLPLAGVPDRIELVLPPQKEAGLYTGYLSSPKLQHSLDRPQRSTNQVAIWEADIRSGLSPEAEDLGRQLGLSESEILRPSWNRQGQRMPMQVDHKVEWQVRPIGGDALFDNVANMELLDARSNQASGQAIHASIQNTRQNLANETGDQSWLSRDITFTAVTGGGSAGHRWSDEEIKRGEHLRVYRDRLAESPYTEPLPSPEEALEARSAEQSTAQGIEQRAALESTIRSLERRYPDDAANIRRFIESRRSGSSYETIRTALGITGGELTFIRSVVAEAGINL